MNSLYPKDRWAVTTLENDILRVELLPQLGNMISSICHKAKDFEFVFQPSREFIQPPAYGSDFSTGPRAGVLDCIPTIDPCYYEITGKDLVDHGDVWALAWQEEVNEQEQEAWVSLPSMPLEFRRKTSLEDRQIRLTYTVKNLDDRSHYYLWTFHGLNNFNDNTRLDFPEQLTNYINVQNDDAFFDLHELGTFGKGSTFKWYFTDPIEDGWASLSYPDVGLRYTVDFNPSENPYLGIWITTGGYQGEQNIGIEPCNGFYDSLEKARAQEKVKEIKAGAIDYWTVTLSIDEI